LIHNKRKREEGRRKKEREEGRRKKEREEVFCARFLNGKT
jgi:hypothetical protein